MAHAAAARQMALVTGASGGIGRELARAFAAGGYDLALVARSGGKLEELAAELRNRYGVAARALARDLMNKLGVQSVRVSPRGLVTRLVRGMQAKRSHS